MLFQTILLACIPLFLTVSVISAPASSPPAKELLWLSAGEGERKPDGSVILPLIIRFGRFPSGNGNPTPPDRLKVRYALATGERWSSKEVRPEAARNGSMVVRVRVGAGERLLFQASGLSREQGGIVNQSATICYQRFGRIKPGSVPSYPPANLLDEPLEIRVTPAFNYWRQTEQPLGITCRERLTGVPCSAITILDEHLPPENIMLDATGSASYSPPDDPVLNTLEERSGKETLLVAESGGHRATFTLALHRNRTAHHKPLPGLLILGGSCGLSVLALQRKRRKTG